MADMKKIGKNNKRRGKQEERNVAKVVGGWRNPDNGTKIADVETDEYCIEVKSKTTGSPAQLIKGWQQALAAAAETGKKPVVVLSYVDKGKRVRWLVKPLQGQYGEYD